LENIVLLKNTGCDYNILIVEDCKLIQDKLYEFLSKFFMEIDTASNGKEGLEKFNNKRYDIVLTDINMPELDGNLFVQKLTKLDNKVQVIVISAFGHDENLLTFHKYGVTDFLQKPIDNLKLVDALLKAIENIKDIINHSNITYTLDKGMQDNLSQLKQEKRTIKLMNTYKGVTIINQAFINDINENTLTVQTTSTQYHLINCEKRTIIVTEDSTIRTNLQYVDKEKGLLILKRFEPLERSPQNRKNKRVIPDEKFVVTRHHHGQLTKYKVLALSINSIALKAPSEDETFRLQSKTNLVLGFDISYTKHYQASHEDKLLKPVKIRVAGYILKIEKSYDGSKKVVITYELNELSQSLLEQYIDQRETDILYELQNIKK
jgi:YesN/AraC family two-component response regulator